MQKYIMVLLSLLVVACVPHHSANHTGKKVVAAQAPAPQAVAKAKKTTVDMQTMLAKKSDDFLFLASKAALNDGDFNTAHMFLKTLAKRSKEIEPQLALARLYIEVNQGAKASALLQPWLAAFPITSSTLKHKVVDYQGI